MKVLQTSLKRGALSGAFAALAACSAGSSPSHGDSVGAGGSNTNGSASAANGVGGANGSSGLGGAFTTAAAGPAAATSGAGGGAQCGGVTSKAEPIPLDIYLMLDSSGSMLAKTGANANGPTKWASITQALSTFFSDPMSAGVGVGIQHFPQLLPGVSPNGCTTQAGCPGAAGPCVLTACSDDLSHVALCSPSMPCQTANACVPLGECNDGSGFCLPGFVGCGQGVTCVRFGNQNPSFCTNEDYCDAPHYSTPTVEITPLNGSATALNGAIGMITPGGLTPTGPALQGAIDHAKAWATANPTHQVVALLATDGEPTMCTPTDIPSVAAIAAAGLSGTPSIKTFAIGVFAQVDITAGAPAALNQIAKAGGTTNAFIINTSMGNVEQSFVNALNSIRSSKLACEFEVPAASAGGTLDYGQVNVEYTPPNASAATTVGYVGKPSQCDPTKGGWYYDIDPSVGTPTKLEMCPATCATFGAGGQVAIRVGCKTVIQPPPT